VELAAGEGGIREKSMAKCEQVTTLDKVLLLRGPFSGAISPEKMLAVDRGIQRAIGIPV
jgi:mRNA-degrading endonuclease toxin of MazEF toxin-antitoxin module